MSKLKELVNGLVGELNPTIVIDLSIIKSSKKKINPITGIYKITSPSSKIYIGQALDIESRIYQYKKLHNCKNQILLYNSLVKYSPENHTFEIINICKKSELNKLEIKYGKKHNVNDLKKGLNIKECGGSKGKHSLLSIDKMSKSQSGCKNHFFNKKHTLESKKKISESRVGKTNPMLGKHHTIESKIKMRESKLDKYLGDKNPFYGKKHSYEAKNKIRKSRIGKTHPLLGKHHSEETKRKISEGLKNKKQSDETKKKRSDSMKEFIRNKNNS